MDLFQKKHKTFKKSKGEGSRYDKLVEYSQSSLGTGDLRQSVKCPEGEDKNEWLAYNCTEFFNQIMILYGQVTQCTKESCPIMNAGPRYEYLWADGKKIKDPITCSAPEYVRYLMEWIHELMDDESIFPSEPEQQFPKGFATTIKNIMKRLFRVYAHIYLNHMNDIREHHGHLNSCFKHFIFFSEEFDLVPKKEQVPLENLINEMLNV